MPRLESSARRDFVEQHIGLVVHIAVSIARQMPRITKDVVSLDDLKSYGWIGLMEAADRFEPNGEASFATFATLRIRGAVLDGIRQQHWISSWMRNKLQQELANSPEATVRCKEQNLCGAALDGAAETYVRLFGPGSPGIWQDPSEVDETTTIEDSIDFERQMARVRALMASRPENERRVIEMVYFEGLSLDEAAKQIGISKPWAWRLRRSAIAYLSERLTAIRAKKLSPSSSTAQSC